MEVNNVIHRKPDQAQDGTYDLIIIGGGIYGAMLALESARRGMKPLLLESADFGGQTSFNSLRIVHGGLRYLQKLDLPRFNESVSERKWFLQHFPELVKPLPCLMPLYGTGLHRPAILRLALKLNDVLSASRNGGVPEANHLPGGTVIDADATKAIFPAVSSDGLKGAGKWFDAVMLNSQRVLIEILRWACRLGTTALNYVEVDDLLTDADTASGVLATDHVTNKSYKFNAPVVVNATGPWSRKFAAKFHMDIPSLYEPSLAWNLLLDRPPLSDHALALNPQKHEGHTYFVVPWNGKIFAGTGHAPYSGPSDAPLRPSNSQILNFLADLNSAVPELALEPSDIVHVHAGLLPTTHKGDTQLTVREVLVDHGEKGGPKGFYSVSGIKFTTARLVAEKALSMIAGELPSYTQEGQELPLLDKYDTAWNKLIHINGQQPDNEQLMTVLKDLMAQESVCHKNDLIYRRTSLYEDSALVESLAQDIQRLFSNE